MAIELPIAGDASVKKQFEELLERFDFGDTTGTKAGNVRGQWLEYVSNATPDTEDTVAHKLERVPTGYFVGRQNKAGSVYDGGTTWTSSNIYLKCDVASVTFRILLW